MPTDEEEAMRDWTIERLRNLVKQVYEGKGVLEVFGSYDTKLYLPTSDVDW
jgi:DNA polymerase sigma